MPNQPSGMRPEHMRSDLGIVVKYATFHKSSMIN